MTEPGDLEWESDPEEAERAARYLSRPNLSERDRADFIRHSKAERPLRHLQRQRQELFDLEPPGMDDILNLMKSQDRSWYRSPWAVLEAKREHESSLVSRNGPYWNPQPDPEGGEPSKEATQRRIRKKQEFKSFRAKHISHHHKRYASFFNILCLTRQLHLDIIESIYANRDCLNPVTPGIRNLVDKYKNLDEKEVAAMKEERSRLKKEQKAFRALYDKLEWRQHSKPNISSMSDDEKWAYERVPKFGFSLEAVKSMFEEIRKYWDDIDFIWVRNPDTYASDQACVEHPVAACYIFLMANKAMSRFQIDDLEWLSVYKSDAATMSDSDYLDLCMFDQSTSMVTETEISEKRRKAEKIYAKTEVLLNEVRKLGFSKWWCKLDHI